MTPIFQTASEIMDEYEKMALEAHYQIMKMKEHNPHAVSPALVAHEKFCCTMRRLWEVIAEKIYRAEHGDEMYGDVYDDWPSQDWGM